MPNEFDSPTADVELSHVQECIAKLQAGDASACNELFRKIGNRLERLARRMLNRYARLRRFHDTQDILQTALVHLLNSLQRIRPDSVRSFYGLAAAQMRRELIDLSRHYFGPHGDGTHQIHTDEIERVTTREDDTGELEAWARFHEAVESLPVEPRTVFELTYYHEWKQAEIAKLLSMSERTVRRYWREALKLLAERVQGKLPGEWR